MTTVPIFLDRFRDIINKRGETAAQTLETRLEHEGDDEVYYVPFEHVNSIAKLVIVGITPGPKQIKLAYRTASSKIKVGLPDHQIIFEAKKQAAFGDQSMRPNLLRMLKHFRFAAILGIEDEEQLWADRADLLHSTSVVPHAAFRKGKPFAGSFEDVLKTRIFHESFERDFVPSLSALSSDAMYVGLGPTALDALEWCRDRGLIRDDQVLGAFAHSSTQAGSQVDVYLGVRSIDSLNEADPVRKRGKFLLPAYARMKEVTDRLRSAMMAAAK